MSVQQSIKIVKKHICKICEFQYKSRQSLWNHNNKFHSNANNNEIYYYDSDKSHLGYNKNLMNKKVVFLDLVYF